MKKNRKVFHIRRQTASAMAVVLAVLSPGVFPAGLAMAESAGTFTPTAGSGYVRQRRVMQERFHAIWKSRRWKIQRQKNREMK